jgi:hypothetical protein
MYTYNDLVAALQSGASVEDIAAQMSKDLNAAKAEYDRLAAERAEAEKKAATEAFKRGIMRDFYTALGTYVTEFYPDSLIAEMIADAGTPTDEDLDQLAEQVNSLVATFEAMKGLTALLDNVELDSPVFAKPNSKLGNFNNKAVDIDPIEAFLNKNVRKH